MTLADTPTSQRKSLPSFVRRLAITLVVALVATAAICVCRLTHRPVGYSGNARISSFLSPDFASGFDVAWEMTASELGVSGQLYSHAKVDNTLVAIFKDKDQPPTLVAIDLRGTQPSVLWHRELAKSSAPILTWDDSIIVDGQTIRVSDGQVTATWKYPIPDSVTSGSPRLYVGQDLDRSEKMSFVAVQWPVAVVCYGSSKPRMFQDYGYMCLGHNKDGTAAWQYAADVRDDSEKPGIPMNVPMVNGYVPTMHSSNVPGVEANRFLNLLDGSVTEPVSADFTTLTPVTDGWAFSGTMADDSETPAERATGDDPHLGRGHLGTPVHACGQLCLPLAHHRHQRPAPARHERSGRGRSCLLPKYGSHLDGWIPDSLHSPDTRLSEGTRSSRDPLRRPLGHSPDIARRDRRDRRIRLLRGSAHRIPRTT